MIANFGASAMAR